MFAKVFFVLHFYFLRVSSLNIYYNFFGKFFGSYSNISPFLKSLRKTGGSSDLSNSNS